MRLYFWLFALGVGLLLAAAPAPKYVTFRDPTFDHAFTAQVPAGWKTAGGTTRPNPFLTTFEVTATSPEGELALRLRVNEGARVHLDQPLGPYREGGLFPITGVGMLPIRRYRPGAEYVTAEELPPGQRDALVIRVSRDWPELGKALARVPGFETVDVGEVAYDFQRGGRAYCGGAFAVTRIYRAGPGVPSLWHCLFLATFEGPRERAEEARAALVRLVSTWKLDPVWLAGLEGSQRRGAEALLQAGRHTAQISSETYWQRQKALDRVFRGQAEAFRGTVQLRDWRTGEEYTLPNTYRYYWIRPNGERIGTMGSAPPTEDAEPLIILDVRQS